MSSAVRLINKNSYQKLIRKVVAYKRTLIAVGCIVTVAFGCWFAYAEYKRQHTLNASTHFAQFVAQIEGNRPIANQLINSDTSYAVPTALLQAKASFQREKYKESEALLTFVRRKEQQGVWHDVATAYLVQVRWQVGDTEGALSLLEQLPSHMEYYKSLTKGTIYAQKRDTTQAAIYYQKAIDFAREHGINPQKATIQLNAL